MAQKKNGFTLVELMIVIALIAILSTVGIIYYFNIQKKARDAIRKADLSAILNALEVNKTTDGYLSLQQNQFTQFRTSDPSGDVYCIAAGNPINPIVTTPWSGICPSPYNAVVPGAPPEGVFPSWKVCTYLEIIPANTANHAFCLSNTQ